MSIYGQLVSVAINIVKIVISIITTVIIIPWLKNTVVPWLSEKRLYGIVKTYVRAAEKMADSGFIVKSEKKRFVRDMLESKGVNVTEEIDALIESAVEELDLAVFSSISSVAGLFAYDNPSTTTPEDNSEDDVDDSVESDIPDEEFIPTLEPNDEE